MPPAARTTAEEKRIARDMHNRGFIPNHIAKHLCRERSTITRLLANNGLEPRRGRPPVFSDAQVAAAIRLLGKMVSEANGEYEITIAMVRTRARLKCTDRTLLDRMRAKCIYFRNLREKPVLTPEDVKAR